VATAARTAIEERERAVFAAVQEDLHEAAVGDDLAAPGPEELERARQVIGHRIAVAERQAATLGEPRHPDPQGLERRLLDELFGLGALQPFLDDEAVEEIIVNGPQRVLVIAGGRKRLAEVTFADDQALRRLVRRAIGAQGGRLDETSPMVDAQLAGGSRLNAVIPPLANATHITIRKFRLRALTLQDLVALETLTAEAAGYLDACVRAGLNILISGGTGSGKTTALNALGAAIAGMQERVITIEETRELRLDDVLPDCVALAARAPTVEGAGGVPIRSLVRNALRMRPTRIIVGEVRGDEALDMLTAMTSGHDGSMCTLHASGPREALSKLRIYALMAPQAPPAGVITEMIAQAIDVVVQLRLDGRTHHRTVSHVLEVSGLEGDAIAATDLFTLDADGRLAWTGIRPRREARLEAAGYAGPGRGGPA